MRGFTAAACAALVVAVSGSTSGAAVIAVDGRVTPDANSSFATGQFLAGMRARLASFGHTVVTVTSYDAASLAGVDVLLTREASQAGAQEFTAQMAADIAAFNDAGGGVAFFADGGFNSNNLLGSNNLVANALGANLVGNAYSGSGQIFSEFISHPVTDGVNQWGLDFIRRVDALPGSVDLTVNDGQENIAVARDGVGVQGNAFVMGDASWLAVPGNDFGLNDLDNSQAFENIIDYLLVPAPGATGLVAIAGVAALRRRR